VEGARDGGKDEASLTHVLLLCPEPLGHGVPAGVGIRFLEFARALVADGQKVTLLTPDGASVSGCTALALSPQNVRDATAAADVAVVQGHIINDLLAHGAPLPTVVDLYDPYIVENLHYWKSRGDEVFVHDHATLQRSLAAGDFFLCASKAQKIFYCGMMIASGRLHPRRFDDDPTLDSLIALAPFGVPPLRRESRAAGSRRILFGGIYDWYSPIVAIDAVRLARESIPDLTLTFTRHPNPEVTPQGAAQAALEHVRKHGLESFVLFEPWTPYESRGDYYDQFSLALLTFPQSIETDLSMRTRIYDFLWAGLPVISSSAAGTDELLEKYGVGVVVRDDSPVAYADALHRLWSEPQLSGSMRQATKRFVTAHQWSSTLQPLLQFCRAPRRDETRALWDGAIQPTTVSSGRPWADRIRRKLRRLR
jgi:glycosyltransferase involved in cell wall biosynthesis